MRQIALFDGSDHLAAPLARRTDPPTSHQAAQEHRDSGRLAKSAAATLAAVKQFGGLTAVELAAKSGLDRYEVSRRLADLKHAGLVRTDKDSRLCTIHRRKMQTWWVS